MLGERGAVEGDVAREILQPEGATEATLHVRGALRREADEVTGVRERQEIVVVDAVRAGPAQVVGDEGGIERVGQARECVEVALVERGVTEEIHAHAVEHDGHARTDAFETLPRRGRAPEEVLADDLDVADERVGGEDRFVVRQPQAETERRCGKTARARQTALLLR